LIEKRQSIKFSDDIMVREFTKCTDSIKFQKKKKQNRRGKGKGELVQEEPKEDCKNKEKIYKELTVKSSLKNSNCSFTYSFAVMN